MFDPPVLSPKAPVGKVAAKAKAKPRVRFNRPRKVRKGKQITVSVCLTKFHHVFFPDKQNICATLQRVMLHTEGKKVRTTQMHSSGISEVLDRKSQASGPFQQGQGPEGYHMLC